MHLRKFPIPAPAKAQNISIGPPPSRNVNPQHASAAANPSTTGEYSPCILSISSRRECSFSPDMSFPSISNSRIKCSSRFSLEVFTPVLVRHSDCVKPFSPSKQVYSIDIRPISAVQVIPMVSASVFMELLTLHAPVPHDRSMIPTRPMMDAFSVRLASVTGTSAPFSSVYSCHAISI